MEAIQWLASAHTQEFIEKVCSEAFCTSLSVERKHNQVRQWETSCNTHIASASRNLMHSRFLKFREEKSLALAAASQRLRRAQRKTVGSLKWQLEILLATTYY